MSEGQKTRQPRPKLNGPRLFVATLLGFSGFVVSRSVLEDQTPVKARQSVVIACVCTVMLAGAVFETCSKALLDPWPAIGLVILAGIGFAAFLVHQTKVDALRAKQEREELEHPDVVAWHADTSKREETDNDL